MYYVNFLSALVVRLPDPLMAEIEAESRRRRISKSDLVRERLELATRFKQRHAVSFNAMADLGGSIDGLRANLTKRKKNYLRTTGYGKKSPR